MSEEARGITLNAREKYKCEIVVAVAGQPNVGKSTLFNTITGEISHVGNWPGVTVSTKIGTKDFRGHKICFVDLPGTYGISATSLEEIIAREYIVSGEPDVILILVDSTAPERTLYLPIQILELTRGNVIIALTKADLAHSYGIHINVEKLQDMLGVPIISISAIKGQGIRELLNKIIEMAKKKEIIQPLKIQYGGLEPFISEVESLIKKCKSIKNYNSRWIAVRLIEGDARLEDILKRECGDEILTKIKEIRESIKSTTGLDPSEIIAIKRFEFVDNVTKKTIVRVKRERTSRLEAFAEYLQKPVIGPILSLMLLFGIFMIIFSLNTGFPLNIVFRELGYSEIADLIEEYSISSMMEMLFGYLADLVRNSLSGVFPDWFVSLLADGIIAGVGAILTFFPLILMVFLFSSMLEDSGFAPRIAAGFHNLFAKFGFSGRAIYPMLVSIGCNVPGVMVSRAAIEDEERLEIIISTPFIPCQARLIVIIAFITAFFSSPFIQAAIMISLYLLGILLFLVSGLMIRLFIFRKKEPPEFLLELPPIHPPNAKVVWWNSWENSKHFLKKAGSVIFLLSIVSWFLLNFGPSGMVSDISESYGAYLGRILAVFFEPFGIPEENAWKIGFAVFFGFIAKEGLIEAIVMLQGGNLDISEALVALGISPLQAYVLLVFFTLYVPCLATVAAMYQESRSVKLVILGVIYMILIAYFLSLLLYLFGVLIFH